MTLCDDVIGQFGRSIGIEGLQLRDNGTLVLDMQRLGKLAFELVGERREDISMSLTHRVELSDERACSRILELCHYREPAPFPTHAGLTRKGDLIFAVGMEASEFTLPNLHEALDWLISLQERSESFASPARSS